MRRTTGFVFVALAFPLMEADLVVAAPPSSAPAMYAIGDIQELSAGTAGTILLEDRQATFESANISIPIAYDTIQNVELGARLTPGKEPAYKVWRLHKRFEERPLRRMLNIAFKDKSGQIRNITLQLSENAALQVQEALELRSGKRRRPTVSDAWWGDSVWKTKRNGDTLSDDRLGTAPAK